MISKKQTSECYVYITLPNEIKAVTAGRFVLDNDYRGLSVGRFVYGKKYLSLTNAVEIDPVELHLSERVYETTLLHGVFGALRDAGPDYWGRRIIEKYTQKTNLDELDYLLYSPDDRAGALGFGINKTPPSPYRNFNKTLQLEKLQRLADAIVKDEQEINSPSAIQIAELILIGTSMGGARPKAVVEDDNGLWLAKFNRNDDRYNMARVEHSMLTLAKLCDIRVAESMVIHIANRDVLLVKRFDRELVSEAYLKTRMVSALTLLHTNDFNEARQRWSYLQLVEEIRRICVDPQKEAHELFKRMCFNALISNTDDHPRNHAIIAKQHDWKLSPAYDLTPARPVSIERRDLALICGDWGRWANADNLLSQASRFLLTREQATEIINTIEAKIKTNWYRICRSVGVTERDCELFKDSFVYPGFRYQAMSD